MNATRNLRRQHDELLEIIVALEQQLAQGMTDREASRRLLFAFSGKLAAHLASEDKVMYPSLLAHEDRHVRALAETYVQEMGGLRADFDAYCKAWLDPSSAQRSPQDFASETRRLFTQLRARIEKENAELYPAVDNAKLAL